MFKYVVIHDSIVNVDNILNNEYVNNILVSDDKIHINVICVHNSNYSVRYACVLIITVLSIVSLVILDIVMLIIYIIRNDVIKLIVILDVYYVKYEYIVIN
jgi:hypothetical protein